MRKGRADKVVYPGAGASLLGENSGIRTREEADALVARFIGTGHPQQPQEPSEPKVRVIDPTPIPLAATETVAMTIGRISGVNWHDWFWDCPECGEREIGFLKRSYALMDATDHARDHEREK